MFTPLSRAALLPFLLTAVLFGQTVNGIISGSVADSTGLAVSGAKIAVVNTANASRYEVQTTPSGDFVIGSVAPGNYTLTVEQAGFKKYEKRDLNLTQAELLSAGRIVLEVGTVTESITVSGSGTAVDVESNDRSQSLSGEQMEKLQSRGRNYLELLNVLPGAIGDERFFGTDGLQSTLTPNFSGLSNMYNSVFVDGASASSAANPQYSTTNISQDSVAEMKVMQSNYRAEDGRNGGAVIKTVVKSGTQTFHGSLYDFERNDFLNANRYFDNLNAIKRPKYRYHTFGGTIGGPATLGKAFNPSREKLFFFFAAEGSPTISPSQQQITQLTVPTALERTGDFSQTFDTNRVQVRVNDPLNAKQQFPGNVIPKSRIAPAGQAVLNLFPQPNFLDTAISKNNYNFNFLESAKHVTQSYTVKIDYNASSRLRGFFRGTLWRQDDESYRLSGQAWPMFKSHYKERFRTASISGSYTVSPTAVMELNIGLRGAPSWYEPVDPLSKVQRSVLGVTLPQFYPANNINSVLPQMSFGGPPNPVAFGGNNLVNMGLKSTEPSLSVNYSVTRIAGPHTLKAGLFGERIRYMGPTASTYAGNLDFSRDNNNAYDSNWGWSNALLGSYRTYSEADLRLNYDLRSLGIEWYVQDTWKATRRLTIDFGSRFTCFRPYQQADGRSRNFIPSLYDPKKSVVLYRPALNANRVRSAQNPLTGEFYPALYIGAIVPGSGDRYNGTVMQTDADVPGGFLSNRGPLVGPRFGFAYDLTGNGKTAIRGGIGLSYQVRANLDYPQNTVNNFFNTFTSYYGTLESIAAVSGVNFPRALRGLNPNAKAPTIATYSFSIQRAVGFGTVVEVAYSGNQGWQIPLRNSNFNTLPWGRRFLPTSIDPSNNGRLSDDFLRPYTGYSAITMPGTTTTNYNGLQTNVQRKFKRGLQYGVAYTWSKAMGFYESYAQYYSNSNNYGKLSFDRTHVVAITYLYDIPGPSRYAHNRALRSVLKWGFDNWQGSGVTSFQSGRPWGVTSYAIVNGVDITGGGDYNRPMIVGDPRVGKSDRTFSRFFNTAAFAMPPQVVGSVAPGNAPFDNIRGPGRNNWDMTFTKNFPIWERKTLVLRTEFYNIFNHASFYQLDNTVRFDYRTGQQTNARFGQLTNTLTARVIQFSVRFAF